MGKNSEVLKGDLYSVSTKTMLVEGIVQNLPEIIGAVKEIYIVHKKVNFSNQVLKNRLAELNINKDNFIMLVQGLTELSKTENADIMTKEMYRDMVKTLFELFVDNMKNSQAFSQYLNSEY